MSVPETAAAAVDPGPRPELTWLPVDRLDVDPSYQRTLDTPASRRHVARIAAEFKWAAFQAILATPAAAADRWLVIDGQHRFTAAKQVGLPLVPAVVVHGIDRVGQAAAFTAANRRRIAVTTQQLFHADLAQGEAAATAVKRLCDEAGIEILRYACSVKNLRRLGPGKTTAARPLVMIWQTYGETIARQAITAIGAAFGTVPGALRGVFFEAAARYLSTGGGPAGLALGLQRLGVNGLEKIAAGLTTNSSIAPLAAAIERATQRPAAPASALPPPKPVPVLQEHAAPPFKPPAPRQGFQDDPRARRDRGSTDRLPAAEPFGRSNIGSTLA